MSSAERITPEAMVLIGAPAYAAPPDTTVAHEKNLVETFVAVFPMCEPGGPLYTVTPDNRSAATWPVGRGAAR